MSQKEIYLKNFMIFQKKIRCEKIGTSYFKGVKSNIEKFYHKKISNLDLKNSEEKMIESFENYLRVKFLEFENENKIDKKFKSFKKEFNEQFKDKITELKDITFDQEKFNSLISQLISDMSLDDNLEEEKIDEDDKDNEKNRNHRIKNKKLKKKMQNLRKCLLKAEFQT